MKRCTLLAGLIASLFCAAPGFSQTVNKTPSPPPQICANGQCATIKSSSQNSGAIKWNPGQYMASEGILSGTSTLADFSSEMDDLSSWDNIIGYRLFVSWGALERAQGSYDFSVLDAILNRLKTNYKTPKRLVIALVPGSFGNCHIGTGDYVPLYIQQNSAYGASPNSGTYGWWGGISNGNVNSCIAAVWRPAVMNRFIALVQALGAHYDSDPDFEAIMIQEDSWVIGNAVDTSPKDSSYVDATMLAQLQSLLTAATSSFPHTSVVMQNTWLQQPTSTQSFEQWMVNNRVAPGSPDSVGQSAFTNYDFANPDSKFAWGLEAYMGVQASGSSWKPVDLRPKAHAFMDVEGPDIAGAFYGFIGAPEGFKPQDIIAALNQTYDASHAFWTHFYSSDPVWPGSGSVGDVAPWAVWSNLAPIINSTPLINTTYPANYP